MAHDIDQQRKIEEITASTDNTPSTSSKESNENDIQMKSDKRAVQYEITQE